MQMIAGARASKSRLAQLSQRKALNGKNVSRSFTSTAVPAEDYDVVVVGAGHNGLTTAAYLAKAGKRVLVLERRPMVGGAAVTEEIVPGYRFSRASYLAGLLRPRIIEELELKKYGLEYLDRDPSSFTPTLSTDSVNKGKYLMLGADSKANYESIAQFSKQDADRFEDYEEMLARVRRIVVPLLDNPLPNWPLQSRADVSRSFKIFKELLPHLSPRSMQEAYEVFLSPAITILDRWFESSILKTTLATDAVIGALLSPRDIGSAYVLLHHVMGEVNGRPGTWAYVRGGMGMISNSLKGCAEAHGAKIVTDAKVKGVDLTEDGTRVTGVRLEDGTLIKARAVVAGCAPQHLLKDLLPEALPEDMKPFRKRVLDQDATCGAFKINLAINKIPDFLCCPNVDGKPGPQHRGTIHFEAHPDDIHNAFREASQGRPATRPVIEMTLPSVVDHTLVDTPGHHVAQLFVQFAPYDLEGASWADPQFKQEFIDRVLNIVEEFAPGFKNSIVGMDALSPLDLEQVFGLPRGNIFHSALALHQLGFSRPAPGFHDHRSPVKGLYMASAGTHPGGGVMGAPGRNAAGIVLNEL